MALTISHPFVSAKSDGTDATLIQPSNWNASHDLTGQIPIANGGTNAATAADARTNLGLGTIATQAASNVALTGGSLAGVTITIADNVLTIQDNVDATKQLQFQLSAITTGTTRTLTVPDASGTVALTSNNLGAFGATTSAQLASVLSDETGSGAAVFATSPTLVTPALGTPSAAVLTNATGLPVSTGLTGLGTGVATFLATPSSANLSAALTDETGTGAAVFATSPTLVTPVLGTPTSVTLTNATGLPLATGITGLGTGVATFLATPTSANLASAVTDETGTGAVVFANSPTLIAPALGTPVSGNLSSCTFPTLNQNTTGTAANVTGTVAVANGGTGLTTLGTPLYSLRVNAGGTALEYAAAGAGDALTSQPLSQFAATTSAQLASIITNETGTGSLVFANTPTLITPILGTPASGNLSNCTNAVGYALKSATTTVSVSAATAPTSGQVLTATSDSTATWQDASGSVGVEIYAFAAAYG